MFSFDENIVQSGNHNCAGNEKFYPAAFHADNIKSCQRQSDAVTNRESRYQNQKPPEIFEGISCNQSKNEQLMIQRIKRNDMLPAKFQIKNKILH